MATTSDDSQEDQPIDEPEVPQWAASLLAWFTRDDVKLLLVTFAGTVAANLVTLVVVAIGIILAKQKVMPPPSSWGVISALCAIGAILALGFGRIAFGLFREWGAIRRTIYSIYFALSGVGALAALVVLLGYAAGIK